MAAPAGVPVIARMILAVIAVLTAQQAAFVESRAVNISNTWVLPEDGFPVFYRYFRDRINWFEADAVCQFHHANLVTVDNGAQFDAARAFLKELDVVSPVWVGLKRASNQPSFLWTNEQPLSGMGYWSEPLPGVRGTEELCAATDPAADYRWHSLSCGGLEVASFICELPVPDWAAARDGCMVENMPSLTVAFLPEEAAVELTSDCGLGGTRRVVCKGNTTREALLGQLSCHSMMKEEAEEAEQQADMTTTAAAADSSSTDTSTDATSPSGPGSTTPAEQPSTRQRRATTTLAWESTTTASKNTATEVDAASAATATSTATSTEDPSSSSTTTSPEGASPRVGTEPSAQPSAQPSAPSSSTPSPPSSQPPRLDTLIVAQKDDVKTAAQSKDAASKEEPNWTPEDKSIIVPIVAKKGPTFPKKVSASNSKPFRPEKVQMKMQLADKVARGVSAQLEAAADKPAAKAVTPAGTKPPVAAGGSPKPAQTETGIKETVVVSTAMATEKSPRSSTPQTATVKTSPAAPPTSRSVVIVESDNKLDVDDGRQGGAAADDDTMLIRELSSARTPLIKSVPVVDVPGVPLSVPDKLSKESAVFLQLPVDGHVARRPPVKKDGLPAAIAGAAVVTTSTTTTTAAPTPPSTPAPGVGTSGPPTSTGSPIRLRESMAGPGGKVRSLTTTPAPATAATPSVPASTAAHAAPAKPTSPTATPMEITSTPTTTTATSSAAPTSTPTSTPISTTTVIVVSTSTTTSAVNVTAVDHPDAAPESVPRENRRRQHLPAPLLSMNMKPDSEDAEEGLESEPQSPPRPNRSRSLVRQQHRSFYPYFLNRVLGR